MENNFENFTKYRARLRYQHFNNNKYSTLKAFNSSTSAVEFWDINFFRNFFNMPCTPDHMRSSTFEKFLNDEIANPTFDWPNMFTYLENLQKHPYFQEYLERHMPNSRPNSRDPLFWNILNAYKQALSGQLNNNQQLWI